MFMGMSGFQNIHAIHNNHNEKFIDNYILFIRIFVIHIAQKFIPF